MTSVSLHGWIETVVEVEWEGTEDQYREFVQLLQEYGLLRTYVERLPQFASDKPERHVYLRVACPAHAAMGVFMHLRELTQRCFPTEAVN